MKKLFLPLSLLLLTTAFIGCGNDNSSSSDETSSSSEESSSSISSSSYSNRLDVDYADTLTLDTIKFENGKDSSSQATPLKLFLGNFPKGTLITISGKKKSGGHADSLYVREEEGSYLKPTTAVIESGDTLYRNYGRLGDSANFVINKFITQLTSGFYYVEIPKISTADNGSYSILITSNIETAYYSYTGDSSISSMNLNDTLHGFFIIGEGSDSVDISFSAPTGVSINVNAQGSNIQEFSLLRGKTVIANGTDTLDQQLLPQDTTTYIVRVKPETFLSYLTGPYAYFDISTTSRELGPGEFFAAPDSIQKVGDSLIIIRPRNDAAKYYLRQDQYVWLANLEKGDSIYIYHDIEGYYSNASYPATYAILDSTGDSIASVTATTSATAAQRLFVAKAAGPYFLHYTRLNSPPNSSSQILTLKTLLQRIHYISSFYFYNEETEAQYSTKNVSAGDTLQFSEISFHVEPSDASSSVYWYIPCADLDYVVSAYSNDNCKASGTEQLFSSEYLAVSSSESSVGETINLIAQSKADPRARDTLLVYIAQ